MPQFKTRSDGPHDVEISGVGFCGPYGSGGVDVEYAATRMHELQNESGEPLSGPKLISAAKKWAEAHGLVVTNKANENAGFPQDVTTPKKKWAKPDPVIWPNTEDN